MQLAFVFPGQGSQSVGMLNDFADEPVVQRMLAEASEALREDLGALIASGPAEALSLTVNTQPAMLVTSLACLAAWRAAGGPPAMAVAGHSLGEYTALAAADAIDFSDAVRLVRLRAQAMQQAVPVGTGSMAAVLGLDDDAVRAACAQAAQHEIVEPANYNAPAQVVIAGHKAAVTRACEAARERGAKRTVELPVSAPFHSSLLEPVGQTLREALSRIAVRTPAVPLVNNVDVVIETDPARVRDALVRQAYSAVRWVEVVRALRELGATHLIEFGPGKVLVGLAKRIDPALTALAVYDRASLQAAMAAVNAGAGEQR